MGTHLCDESAIVLRCLIRQLTPFSPQSAIRQAELLNQYIRILQTLQFKLQTARSINREVGMVTSGGLIDLEWVKPLVNCTTVATFPGLALSKIAYGTSELTELQTFLGPHEEQPLSDDHGHPVCPSMPCYILVWEELHQILVDVLLKDSPSRIYSHFGLFSNEHTKNVKPSLLSSEEPFIVRLGLQNPFPFPLTLRNLCLSLDQIKLRPGYSPPFFDKFQCSIISELILPPWITDQQPSAIELKNSRQFVDLHVLPGPELEHFTVNGIKFELCSPPIQTEQPKDEHDQSVEKASVSAFVPISIRGKRLFKTKEQRISKQYGMDKRLSAVVCSDFVPLLSFRPIGGDPSFIKAITHWHPLETFCDQIVQIVFEIENVGKIDVEQLRFCTNLAEQVSVSEPSDNSEISGRWTQCPTKSLSTSFTDDLSRASEFSMETATVGRFGKICENNPLEIRGKIGMRVAIRVQENPQSFFFLFLYIDKNGRSRQFRFFVQTRPLSRIFDAHLCVLSEPIGLCMLKLRCLPFSAYESDGGATTKIFIKLDLLRLSTKLVDGNVRTIVRRMDTNPVQLESATEQNLCFYVSNLEEEEEGKDLTTAISDYVGWTDVWLGKTYVPDFPEWQIMARNVGRTPKTGMDHQQEAGDAKIASIADTLQLKLLWKASIIRGDGTVHTVFGELIKYSCQNDDRMDTAL